MPSFSGDETAPFFGFLGAAAALVFSCKHPPPPPLSLPSPLFASDLFDLLPTRHGRGVRDGEERRRRGVDGGDAAGARHEVDRPRRHGRGPRDLRPHHSRHHQHGDQPQGQALLPLRRLRAPLLRPRLRAWPGSPPAWPSASSATPASEPMHNSQNSSLE
ncbi:V-type proton ATPase 16 kDa proteolipid subunit [Iris pallida]|uniref:V-type proton ATPase 16 kDa proteolipid subunit n=1 Tax=Iris pallida TaxID=29817 RepID=A0AAX6F1W2_IRIPA|nr:V-type proton ATPase 16 kDa proteolipid subunit [Iris pallida]